MDRQREAPGAPTGTRELKVIMVHGIGTHLPGYSTRLQENLARTLGLSVVSERPKEIHLQQPLLYPEESLGVLRAHRYVAPDDTAAMTFFEVTWSPIADPQKRAIAYDSSGEYTFRRATINALMKDFVNTHLPDPLIYLGTAREKMQVAVTQGLCWAVGHDWNDLPDSAEGSCPLSSLTAQHLQEDDHVFVSHSLGSRIVTDSLQRMSDITKVGVNDLRLQGHGSTRPFWRQCVRRSLRCSCSPTSFLSFSWAGKTLRSPTRFQPSALPKVRKATSVCLNA